MTAKYHHEKKIIVIMRSKGQEERASLWRKTSSGIRGIIQPMCSLKLCGFGCVLEEQWVLEESRRYKTTAAIEVIKNF